MFGSLFVCCPSTSSEGNLMTHIFNRKIFVRAISKERKGFFFLKNALWMLKFTERFEMSSHSPCFLLLYLFWSIWRVFLLDALPSRSLSPSSAQARNMCCAKAITNNYSKSNNQKLPHEMLIQLLVVEDKMANSHSGFSWSGEERWEILLLSNTLKNTKKTQSRKKCLHSFKKRERRVEHVNMRFLKHGRGLCTVGKWELPITSILTAIGWHVVQRVTAFK